MASFNQRAIKWVDYIKENCIDALKKYCEDQASNDLTAEEKQDVRDYLENFIKTPKGRIRAWGIDRQHRKRYRFQTQLGLMKTES